MKKGIVAFLLFGAVVMWLADVRQPEPQAHGYMTGWDGGDGPTGRLQDPRATANAKLDAEIRHAIATKGVYEPPNALRIDYKSRALTLCSRYAKSAARHPSTVSFSGWGSRVTVNADNSADVTASFTAKNSFGLELEHRIACRVTPSGEVTAAITEAG
ncbi:hypothetical protein [Hyphomicrobium sp. CS1GBMeth3]|uniref:hypothetical protein n=1 Tax=Hyphomicrobium sp. CS1GBMeth3 TaxID=1892845 RepID=UPI000930118A|nr:hypothetical protein [Hyphomicrobium sp. CS1GBMeth3]